MNAQVEAGTPPYAVVLHPRVYGRRLADRPRQGGTARLVLRRGGELGRIDQVQRSADLSEGRLDRGADIVQLGRERLRVLRRRGLDPRPARLQDLPRLLERRDDGRDHGLATLDV